MTGHMGYVTNTYSASGRVQVQIFGEHDGVGDPTQCKWCYVDGGTDHIQAAKAGKYHALQPGARVYLSQLGGPDGSFHVHGTSARGGKGTGGGGGLGSGQSDGSTSMNDVDRSYSDQPIPLENPNQQDGMRCMAKPPDGRYHPDCGQPLDMTQNQYPSTIYAQA